MEQEPTEKKVNLEVFKVLWHQNIREDLSAITPSQVDSIIKAAEHRLSRAPQYIGQPLKGTTNLLWKIRFGKYRAIYTINAKKAEVWVLAVQKRECVYRDHHVQSLLNLAIALHEQMKK